MKKSKLCKAIAMATALGGFGVGLYAPAVEAVTLSPTGQGDVLIFPYYTARDGYQTTMTFINTSADFLAVKFRFMEGYNSRDVLDFVVVMSPFDVYTGVVEAGGSTGTQFRIPTQETTCSAPALAGGGAFSLSPIAYTGTNNDGGPQTNDRLVEGYVLAMVMGSARKADLVNIRDSGNNGVGAYPAALRTAAATLLSAEHPNTTAECTAVSGLFAASNFAYNDGTAALASAVPVTPRLFGEPTNVLKGNYSLLNVPRGVAFGGNAVTLSNFFNAGATDTDANSNPVCTIPYNAQFNYKAYPTLTTLPAAVQWAPAVAGGGAPANLPTAANGGCPNMVTPQEFPQFLEPSLNNAYSAGATGRAYFVATNDSTVPAMGVYTSYPNSGFQAVSEVLRAATVFNEWSVNPDLGVSTDWVVTHPTKAFFVDDPTQSSTSAVAVGGGYPAGTPLPAAGSVPRADVVQAAVNQARFSGPAAPVSNFPVLAWLPTRPAVALHPFTRPFSSTSAAAGTSCVTIGVNIWDRDELTSVTGGVTPSPIEPTAQRQLCHEVNVLSFNDTPVFGSDGLLTDLSGDVAALEATATSLGRPAQPFGWLLLSLNIDPATQGTLATGTNTSPTGTTLFGAGLPAVGFMARERVIDTTNVTGNYGDSADHSYTR